MSTDFKEISAGKKALFSCLPLLLLLMLLELTIRFAYFQFEGPDALGVITAYHYVQRAAVKKMAEVKVRRLNLPADLAKGVNLEVHRALYSLQGWELLEEFRRIYQDHFQLLVQETRQIQSKPMVRYIPTGNFLEEMDIVDENRIFSRDLCGRYGIDLIDLTQTFANIPPEVVTLLPEDGHLSRYGYHLVPADQVDDTLVVNQIDPEALDLLIVPFAASGLASRGFSARGGMSPIDTHHSYTLGRT